jgi:hypothetical protein
MAARAVWRMTRSERGSLANSAAVYAGTSPIRGATRHLEALADGELEGG